MNRYTNCTEFKMIRSISKWSNGASIVAQLRYTRKHEMTWSTFKYVSMASADVNIYVKLGYPRNRTIFILLTNSHKNMKFYSFLSLYIYEHGEPINSFIALKIPTKTNTTLRKRNINNFYF